MKKANAEIRSAIFEHGICQWQVAERYGMCDSAFSRMLRRELPEDKKQIILSIIEELRKESEV